MEEIEDQDSWNLKDKKMMDTSTLWQWRVMHVKKHSRSTSDPLNPSNKIGLDFNVGSNRGKKLDLELVTNGVIIEICDFAKTVNRSEKHFIANILENNFDLGLENEEQRVDFADQLVRRVENLLKNPADRHEVFTLFDNSECNSKNSLNMETLSVEMNEAHAEDIKHQDEVHCSGEQSKDLQADVLPSMFPYCEKIGLNLGVESKQNLDPGFLTKGVMLEVARLAKVLAGSYSQIILKVLEHNFELDLTNQEERNQVLFRIGNLMKRTKQLLVNSNQVTPAFRNEPFSFHTTGQGFALSDEADSQYHPEEVTKRKQEKRDLLVIDEQVSKRCRREEYEHMDPHHTDLGTSQITDGDSSYTCLVGESGLDSNGEMNSNNADDQDTVQDLLLRSPSPEISRESESCCVSIQEPFLNTDSPSTLPSVSPPLGSYPDKMKPCVGQEQTQTSRNMPNVCDIAQMEICQIKAGENSYMCPLGESDVDSDGETDSRNANSQDILKDPTSSSCLEMPKDSESSCVIIHGPSLPTIDSSSPSLPSVNQPVGGYAVKKDQCEGQDTESIQTQSPRNIFNECDMKREEIETKDNMWKMRAKQVEHIVSALDKEYCNFRLSKVCGIDFNLGFDPKQNVSFDYLTNSIVLETAKFALAMNSSQQDFIMEILENNFDLGLENDSDRSIFARETMKRVTRLKNSADVVKLSKELFQLPLPMASVNMANENMCSVSTEVSSISMKECSSPECSPDSEAKGNVSEKSVDPYPFCKEIGLKLYLNNHLPVKLDVNTLTNGAIIEVTNFADKLCGTFEQIFLDVLRHNFDLDNQTYHSDLSENILTLIPLIVQQRNLGSSCGKPYKKFKRMIRHPSIVAKLDFQNNTNIDVFSSGSSQAPAMKQNVDRATEIEQNEPNEDKELWKLRANIAKQILSMPHVEHCPLYSYSKCKEIGLDFNVGSGVKQNLDPKLMTNGVMVEVATFAAALQSAEKHFIIDILEYNFDLNLDSEVYRNAFAQQTLAKIKAMNVVRKQRVQRMKLPFELPNYRCIEEAYYSKNAHCPKCFQNRNQTPGQSYPDLDYLHHLQPHAMIDTISSDVNCTAQTPFIYPAIEKDMMDNYPHCRKIGLTLCVNKKQRKTKLSKHVLTLGVMNEVADLAKKLCGTSKNQLMNDIISHNFNIGLQRKGINPAQQFHRMLALYVGRLSWFNEVFVVQSFSQKDPEVVRKKRAESTVQNNDRKERTKDRMLALQTKRQRATMSSKQKKRALTVTDEMASKRHRGEPSEHKDHHHTDLGTCQITADDYSYTCPLGKSDLDSDGETDSRNADIQDKDLQSSLSPEISRESESSCVGIHGLFLTTTNSSSHLPVVSPPLGGYTDNKPCEGQEQQQFPRNLSKGYDMENEEIKTEDMWKMRVNKVQHILFALNKEYCTFNRCKVAGMDFNVGFGPKQNVDINCLTKAALVEVAKFALAMNSSQQDFIMEILENNFDLHLENDSDREVFARETMNRVRRLKNSADVVKLSKELFQLPLPMASVNMANEKMRSVSTEVSSISMKECSSPECSPDSHPEAKGNVSEKGVDPYPFCKEIGLKLCVNNRLPVKLDINTLTNGAITEVTKFADKLCGTFEQICLDILRHNFDLDNQSDPSEIGKNILAHIPLIVEQTNLVSTCKGYKKLKHWKRDDSLLKKVECQDNTNIDVCSDGSSQAPATNQNFGSATEIEQNEPNEDKELWKLRANKVKHILSVPHDEHCPLYSYSRCKKIGMDFNVGSGVKPNLDPKLLTNGIMVDLNTLGKALHSAKPHFITEILEYNFDLDLDLNSDQYRSAFEQEIMSKIRPAIYYKKCIGHRKKIPFELPHSGCINHMFYVKSAYCPKCYQNRNEKPGQDDFVPGYMHHHQPHAMTETASADADCSSQKPFICPTVEKAIMDRYPHCKEIGLSLCVNKDQPKEKLSKHVLTFGVMEEVANFASKLCAQSKNKIINDIVEHNFNISTALNPAYQFNLVLPQHGGQFAWLSEVVTVQPVPQKDPEDVNTVKTVSVVGRSKRKERRKERLIALRTKKESAALSSTCQIKAGDISYMCPLGESDVDSDGETDSRNANSQDILKDPTGSLCLEIPKDSESSSVIIHGPSLPTTDSSSSLPSVNQPVGGYAVKKDQCEGQDTESIQTQSPRNIFNECDMKQEEIETEDNMWKMRAKQVEHILSALDKEYCTFHRSKAAGMDFNLGFGPKQNLSFDFLTNSLLVEVAKFAIAMSSSQHNFTMKILENNFDLHLENDFDRKVFACETMKRVRRLKNSADVVKLSKELFQLPLPMASVNMANENMRSVSTEVSSISMKECSSPECSPDSEAKGSVSEKSVDPYPFCKEIGLKLYVNNRLPVKLDVNTLTNGAITEVTNFADKLCGTFEQIFLDVLRHNFDHSDLAKNIFRHLPLIVEQRNLSSFIKVSNKKKSVVNSFMKNSIVTKLDCQNNTNIDVFSSGSSQAPAMKQNVDRATEIEQNEPSEDKELWKLRANVVKQILSMPHEEHCLLYSYPRFKKIGMDFNIGSGVKPNLDPELLTNGVMVEVIAFATALLSTKKHFITEILEYNFHLNLDSEQNRIRFAQQTLGRIQTMNSCSRRKALQKKRLFELPDSRCIDEVFFAKTAYCPKCFQDRNQKAGQESLPGYMNHHQPHAMAEPTSTDADCSSQKPFFSPTVEEKIMDNYPHCKEIGLSLCVKDQPKEKVPEHLLTLQVMNDVANFATRLCGRSKWKIVNDIIEHNFNISPNGNINPALLFNRMMTQHDGRLAWFNEVFLIQPMFHRDVSKLQVVSDAQKNERKVATKERMLALQTKKENSFAPDENMPSEKTCATKSRKNLKEMRIRFPLCHEIGLDLDVKSKSGDKEKLDLNLLTRAVVAEIYRFAIHQERQYLPDTLYKILDYNFDISSQYYRQWEFSLSAASTLKTVAKNHRKTRDLADKLVKLPFVFRSKHSLKFVEKTKKTKCRNSSLGEPNKKKKGGRFVQQIRCNLNSNPTSSLGNDDDTVSSTDRGMLHVHIKEERDEPLCGDVSPDPDTGERCHPHYADVITELEPEDVKPSVTGEPSTSTQHTNTQSSVKTEQDTGVVEYYTLAKPLGPEASATLTVCPDTVNTKNLAPVKAAESQGWSMMTMCQGSETSAVSRVPVVVPELRHGVTSYTESEMSIKQEDL